MQELVSNQPDSKSPQIELHYFPCLAYFACLWPHDTVVIEAHENYIKQTYRNRCSIRTANKVVSLSVPVVKGNTKQLIRDIQIDYKENWLKDHWRTIASAYGKAPFFDELAPVFEKILFQKHRFVFDLNLEILTKCLWLLGWTKQLRVSEQYLEETTILTNFRNYIHPKKPELWANVYQPVPYLQNFGSDFVPNLSVLDVLFCEGTYASEIIRQSAVTRVSIENN